MRFKPLPSTITLFLILFLHANLHAQVNTERFRIAADSLGFSVRSDLNFTLMAGNSDFQYMGTNTRFNYNWGTDYTFLVTNGGYGKNSGKSFFSQSLLHLRNVNSLNDIFQIETFLQYDNNKKLLLMHRGLVGAGARLKVINREKLITRVGLSVFYEREEYDLPESAIHKVNDNHVRLSTYITFTHTLNDNVSLLSTSYLQPDLNESRDFRMLSDSALNVKLADNVALTTTLNMRRDSRPADGIKKFDLTTRIGVSLAFE